MGGASREGGQRDMNMNTSSYAVILAGGRGERFWPLSTMRRPKQFLSLVGNKTLLTMAVERLKGVVPTNHIFVITNRDLLESCHEAAPMLPVKNIIGEPVGRDTAAAIALGASIVKHSNPDASFCVMTADHVIGDLPLFRRTLKESFALAAGYDVLVTIGITPVGPSTAYGYIEAAKELKTSRGIVFQKARRFVEKPDRRTAEKYVASGKYSWNSGMFIWSLKSFEQALNNHRPVLARMMNRLTPLVGTNRFTGAMAREYRNLEKISIDYALMEKADNIVAAKGSFLWDDVGSWPALANHVRNNREGNTVLGKCESLDSSGNIVVSRDRLTALIGVDNLVVVQAPGATLVCSKERSQDIKKLVEKLKADGHYETVL